MAGKITSKISTKTKENTVGVIAAIIVLLIILLVVAISFKISSSRRSQNLGKNDSSQTQPEKLVDNATNNSVRIYVERGVIADEKHYSIDMTVSANSRTIRVMRGYENIEESSNGLPNNLEAYRAFLKALERNHFTAVRIDKSGFGFREACPTQRSFRFTLTEGASQSFDRWFTFCDGTRYGDYGGKVNDTFALFRNQFPDYSTYTSGVSF
jgi:hypothetical protein